MFVLPLTRTDLSREEFSVSKPKRIACKFLADSKWCLSHRELCVYLCFLSCVLRAFDLIRNNKDIEGYLTYLELKASTAESFGIKPVRNLFQTCTKVILEL